MPYVSQAQRKWAFSGGFSKDDAEKWAHETPDMKNLPQRVGKRKKPKYLRVRQ